MDKAKNNFEVGYIYPHQKNFKCDNRARKEVKGTTKYHFDKSYTRVSTLYITTQR
jgi:hypothetical protein